MAFRLIHDHSWWPIGVAALLLAAPGERQSAGQQTAVLFQNVRIFDGTHGQLSPPAQVLIRGNKIEKISTTPLAANLGAGAQVIDGKGRTLMPGLIDNHWHAMLVRPTPPEVMEWDIGYTTLVAGSEAEATLMRGFTTVRDL